jgi:mannose-6-phosphate isomerase-like protein (cupin superfamily)
MSILRRPGVPRRVLTLKRLARRFLRSTEAPLDAIVRANPPPGVYALRGWGFVRVGASKEQCITGLVLEVQRSLRQLCEQRGVACRTPRSRKLRLPPPPEEKWARDISLLESVSRCASGIDEPGGKLKGPSSREYETVGYVISGSAKLDIEGQTLNLKRGDSWLVPAGAMHQYTIIEPFTAVEATAPPAEVHGRDTPE